MYAQPAYPPMIRPASVSPTSNPSWRTGRRPRCMTSSMIVDLLIAQRAAPDVEVVDEAQHSASLLRNAHSATPCSASALPMILASSGFVFWNSLKSVWRSPWLSSSTSQSFGQADAHIAGCVLRPAVRRRRAVRGRCGVTGMAVGCEGVGAGRQAQQRHAQSNRQTNMQGDRVMAAQKIVRCVRRVLRGVLNPFLTRRTRSSCGGSSRFRPGRCRAALTTASCRHS